MTDEKVYVTHFLSFPQAGKIDGQDDAKAGRVSVLSTSTDTVTSVVAMNPIADTGFKALGDALARIAPPANPVPADFKFTTGAYPNQLNSIGIKGNFAFVPNTGASPNGPVRFDVNTHSLLSVLDRNTNLDAGQTLNMHTAVRDQTATPKLFITQPWAIAFKNVANEGYVVSAASNHVVKVVVNPATGAPVVQTDPTNTARVLQVQVGKNPRGIVVNSTDTRAYVMNYISRNVTVISLTSAPETVLATLPSAALPTPGTLADAIHIGKELYNTSIGEFDPAPGTTTPITGRMSNNGWGSCAACHSPFGTTDNVVWIFPAGPRRSIPQHTDFDQTDPTRSRMRALLWSAGRDEQEDFENNIRAVSGGLGLIVLADGITQDTNTPDLLPTPPATPIANGGRNQLKVRGVGGWDAIKAFVQFGIRSPISPVAKNEPDVVAGRALFQAANCQSVPWRTAVDQQHDQLQAAADGRAGRRRSTCRSVAQRRHVRPGRTERNSAECAAAARRGRICTALAVVAPRVSGDVLPQRQRELARPGVGQRNASQRRYRRRRYPYERGRSRQAREVPAFDRRGNSSHRAHSSERY